MRFYVFGFFLVFVFFVLKRCRTGGAVTIRTQLHRPGLFTAAAPPVTGAQLPPLVSLSLSLCVRGRDFVSGEKLSVCDGGRDVCVRACVYEWDPAIALKKNVTRTVFGLCSCG